LWYDFSDEATVTVSSSQITQVNDKGSAGLNLTKSTTGPAYLTGINGLKCVDWGSSPHANFLRNTVSSFSLAEIYVVQDASFGASFPTANGLLGTATGEGVRLYGSGANTIIQGFNSAFLNGSNTSANPGIASLNSASLLRLRFDSPYSMIYGFILGNETVNFGLNRGWYGLIGEVIGFSSHLSDTNRTRLQTYLALKWGLLLS
jgi:hypothetical protein